MTIPRNAAYGYMTSNRPGTGSDDIYKINFTRNYIQNKFRELYVYDKTSLRPIPGASVASCDKQTYVTDVSGKIAVIPCNNAECKVIANTLGYSEKSILLQPCKMKTKEMTRDTIWMDIVVNKKIVLRNIYYDFDKWDILPESASELDQLVSFMNENPEVKVELGSHTDERGTSRYNRKLSQLRAESAVDYITSKGIDKTRITGKGYGKSQLINKCNKDCTPAQHRENRRTEIMIPGFLRGEPVKQDKGDYSNGMLDHSKDYSSLKQHGSLDEKKLKEISISNPIDIKERLINAKDTNTDPQMKFYLTIATFKLDVDALEFVDELKAEGYTATILGEADPFTVGIRYKKLSDAKKTLEYFISRYEDAWIQGPKKLKQL